MDDFDDSNVVSSSSCPSTSSSSSSSPQDNGESLCPRGTPVSLQGQLLLEMDNALVLNVDWKGRNFAGTLIKVDDPNSWGPQCLQSHPPPPKKLEKTWKHLNAPGYKKNRAPRQKGIYSVKYPRSFVDRSNIVESRLRYGRDKRVAAYSSCPSSPKISDPRSDASNSSGSSFVSSTRRSSSFSFGNFSEALDNSQPSCSNFRNIRKCRTNTQSASGDEETQCNEVGSSRPNYETINKTKLKSREDVDQIGTGTQPFTRSVLKEQSAENNNDSARNYKLRKQNDSRTPRSVSFNPIVDGKHDIQGSGSNEVSKQNVFSASPSKIQEPNSLGVETEQRRKKQFGAIHPKIQDPNSLGVQTEQRSLSQFSAIHPKNQDPNSLGVETQQRSKEQFAATHSKLQDPNSLGVETEQRSKNQFAATHPKKRNFRFFKGVFEKLDKSTASESNSEKTNANLENCDFSYLNLSGTIDNQNVLGPGEDRLPCSVENEEETQSKACLDGNANNMQCQNILEPGPSMDFSDVGYSQMDMDIQSNLSIQNMLVMMPDEDLVHDANN